MSVFCNITPYFEKYNAIFINYSDIKKIPGDFITEDLFDLLDFYQKKQSNIFINFYEIENENNKDSLNNKIEDNNFKKFIELIKKYNLSQIVFFFDTKQSEKIFPENYSEIEIFNYSINNNTSSTVKKEKEKEIKEKIFGIFLIQFLNFTIISPSKLNIYD